jgi:hypothetical protein
MSNRALSPSSKLAIEQWAAEAVFLGGEETPLQVQHFYRAMDFLLEHAEAIQKEVFWSTASVLNLAVDLIFFDTTNIYFEIDEPGPSELKAYGKSKEKRDDLPLVTVGLAVTREGIPVRCWVLPGNLKPGKRHQLMQPAIMTSSRRLFTRRANQLKLSVFFRLPPPRNAKTPRQLLCRNQHLVQGPVWSVCK